jgi:hypothetical protein
MASEEQRAYREKLRSLGFQAKPLMSQMTTLYDDDRGGGRIAGYQTEHKDGHVDAVITPPSVNMSSKVNQ